MKLKVLRYPDPKLRRKAQPVIAVTDELRKLATDMLDTMYDENGIGLAATQVGETVSLLVIDIRSRDESGQPTVEGLTELEKAVAQPLVIFNPEIRVKRAETSYEEGCLSVPGFFESVERAEYVEVHGLDQNGKPLEIKTDGLLAICLQHEMDHLDGKLFIDRLSLIRSNKIKNRIKKSGYPTSEEMLEARAAAREERSRSK